jgi:hypothetical protein
MCNIQRVFWTYCYDAIVLHTQVLVAYRIERFLPRYYGCCVLLPNGTNLV